jgi:hypothetical protein
MEMKRHYNRSVAGAVRFADRSLETVVAISAISWTVPRPKSVAQSIGNNATTGIIGHFGWGCSQIACDPVCNGMSAFAAIG